MSSVRDSRQRAAARARLERAMAARQEAARRKRFLQTTIGGSIAGVVVLAFAIWIIVAATSGGSEPVASGPTLCVWTPDETASSPSPSASPAGSSSPSASGSASASASASPSAASLGLPPTDVPRSGFQVVTFTTNQGVVKVEMDLSKTPCTAASIAHLASKKYYDGTSCHRLVANIFALQCGDPTYSGSGGPGYKFEDENLPKDKLPAYHEGDVAMANSGPNTNGSQFFFIWANNTLQGDYSLFGRVIEGLDVVKKVAAGGDDGAFEAQAGGGHPKLPFKFVTVTVSPATAASVAKPTTAPPASSSAPPTSSPAATTSPSTTPSAG